ncbi:MAG: PAS domain S-box protein [Acidobacteria bacterium]|nr:PAS domain S-box protein [Acidobacteriota bacterium]
MTAFRVSASSPGFADDPRQKQWQALLDSAGEGIWGVDRAGNCTFVNRLASQLFGFTSEEMLGRNMHDLIHHHHADGVAYPSTDCPIYGVFRDSQPVRNITDTLFRKDGTSFMAELCAQPVTVDGSVFAVVVTFRDITVARQQQADLHSAYDLAERRTAELDAVIESIPHGIYIATRDGQVRSNQRARDMAAHASSDATATEPEQAFGAFPKELHTLDRALAGEPATEIAHTSIGWIHSVAAPIVLNGEVLGSVAVNTDITQARLQEEALRRSEKLAAVGQLASSIAHEINNPLESITNLLYLIRSSTDLDDIHAYTSLAESELSRVTEITLQTLRFHRQQSRPTQVDLADLLGTILALYTGRFLVRAITAELEFIPAPNILCLEGEIRQVVNNLIRNAVDAMPSGGRLIIRIHPQTSTQSNQAPQQGVRITVADTGEGIAPRILDHLYEPFQTTKEITGTGLGLWVSKGIVDKHGGLLHARTRRGDRHGTVFTIWLPAEGIHLVANGTMDVLAQPPTPISAPAAKPSSEAEDSRVA